MLLILAGQHVTLRRLQGRDSLDGPNCFASAAMDSPCECEYNNPDSLDARLFLYVVSAVAPAVTMDGAFSLSWFHTGNLSAGVQTRVRASPNVGLTLDGLARCIRTYIRTYVCTYVCIRHIVVNNRAVYIHASMHACIYACIHSYPHAYMHTRMHACIHTYMHTAG